MSFKHVKIGFYFIVIFFSVVHNLKHDTAQSNQGQVFTELKKNISFVNHLLQDLMQKYAKLQEIAKTHKENTVQKIDTNVNDFYNADNKRVRENAKMAKPHEYFGTTPFQSDESSESVEKNTNKKQVAKESTEEEDSLSQDSLELLKHTTTIKPYKDSQTQYKKDVGGSVKKKILSNTDYATHKVRTGNPDETDLRDEEKVLIIHLGSTNAPNVRNRASSPRQQSEVIIPITNKKAHTAKSVLSKSETTRHHDSDLEEEIAMEKEMLSVKQLRKAYRNACSQVVARKCQSALKSVLKDICKSGRKCSDDFNEDFANNGNAACEKEFNQKMKKRGRHDDYQYSGDDVESKHQQNSELTGAQFIDYTREGYLDMTCLQALSNIKEPSVDRTNAVKNDTKTQKVNQLRDRYEKACKQASYDKCITACNSTTEKTCKKYDCVKEKTKALKQSCKRRCKESNSFDGGDSDDSSDSDSDSDDSD